MGGCWWIVLAGIGCGWGGLLVVVGRRSMAGMRMRIDAANNTVTVNLGAGSFTIRCDVSSSGHLVLSLWDSSHRASL